MFQLGNLDIHVTKRNHSKFIELVEGHILDERIAIIHVVVQHNLTRLTQLNIDLHAMVSSSNSLANSFYTIVPEIDRVSTVSYP
jgi:hypothetical protein